MKYPWLLLATILVACSSPCVIAEEVVMSQPLAATTLRYSDHYASAFYTVDKGLFNVVLAFTTGMEGDQQLIRQRFQLEEGQTYRLSIGGYAGNRGSTSISMTRKHNRILAEITTCESGQGMPNCI
ncbi:MAG: hypothetical protein P8103_04245 [Candidatus Thiodiazotropha sp.]